MFSGKTEELIRRLKRAKIAKQTVEIFKPKVDTRYDEIKIVSHDSNFILSTPVPLSSNILLLSQNVDVVGIDEAQFFDDELPNVCSQLANSGMRVIVAGLDIDYLENHSGPCLSCWLLQIMLPKCMQYACTAVTLPIIRTELYQMIL
jgi:thymidine kinase